MATETRSRVNFAVDLVLIQIIAPVGEVALGRVLEFVARLDFLLVGVAVGAEGFLVAGGAGILGAGIGTMLCHEIGGLVIQGSPGVAMAFAAIGEALHLFGVHSGDTVGVCAGIENAQQQRNHYDWQK
jgi:hypothetical protein